MMRIFASSSFFQIYFQIKNSTRGMKNIIICWFIFEISPLRIGWNSEMPEFTLEMSQNELLNVLILYNTGTEWLHNLLLNHRKYHFTRNKNHILEMIVTTG